MQSLRQKVATAKKNEKITEKLLQDLQLYKEEVKEEKKVTSIKKMRVELQLRLEQCKALEFEMIEPDAVEEDHQERVASVQKKVQSLEEEIGQIEKELAELAEQEEAITEDLVDAKACHVRAYRSLSAMRKELEELESSWKEDLNSQAKMISDSSKERI